VAALTYGPLTLVQSLGALTVIAAVPLGARDAGRRVSHREWWGIALTLAGFGALLPLTATDGGSATALTTPAALAVALTAFLVIVPAKSVPAGSQRALVLAVASGIASGAGSALTQTVLNSVPLLSWTTALVAVPAIALAVTGLLLSQCAYTDGLGGPLAALTLANPVASAVIGLTLLGEQIHGGPIGTGLALSGAVLASRGIVLLTRTSAVSAAGGHSPQSTTAKGSEGDTAQVPRPSAAHRIPYPRIAGTAELEGTTL
jgi:hypothetical protein